MYTNTILKYFDGIGKETLGVLNLGKLILGFLNNFPGIQGVLLLILSNIVSEPMTSSFLIFFFEPDCFCIMNYG